MRALRSRPLDLLLQAPPADTPLIHNLRDKVVAGVQVCFYAVTYASVILKNKPDFWRYLLSLWPALYRWLLYMAFPIRQFRELSLQDQSLIIDMAITAHSTLHDLLGIKWSREEYSILVAADHSALFVLTTAYIRHSRLQFSVFDTPLGPLDPSPDPLYTLKYLAQRCASRIAVCMQACKNLGIADQAMDTLDDATGGDPGRVMNASGRYLRMLCAEGDTGIPAGGLLCYIIFFVTINIPRYSRAATATLLDAMHRISKPDYALDFQPEFLRLLWGRLHTVLASSHISTVVAIRSGLVDAFGRTAPVTPTDFADFYRAAGYDPGEGCASMRPTPSSCASEERASGAPEQKPTRAPEDRSSRDPGRGIDVLDEASRDWRTATRCANLDCTHSRRRRRLRACACARALYCSETCQRLHWREGGHRETCKGRTGREDTLTARDVHLLSIIVRELIIDNFPPIAAQCPTGPVRARVVADIRKPASSPELQVFPLEDSSVPVTLEDSASSPPVEDQAASIPLPDSTSPSLEEASLPEPLLLVEATVHSSWPAIVFSVRPASKFSVRPAVESSVRPASESGVHPVSEPGVRPTSESSFPPPPVGEGIGHQARSALPRFQLLTDVYLPASTVEFPLRNTVERQFFAFLRGNIPSGK
ncbi:hypothetical protein K523DRAFT_416995 [Schizophyllum commune Tattone D]|nr:hypothetical protein K523DRAFT_416995 [Schizophyllum commune Tattone D]